MVIFRLCNLLFVFEIILCVAGSTHWVVTENGRIQTQLDSPFYLRRPYDLLALLDQEVRRTDINTLYQDLLTRKTLIETKSSGLERVSDLDVYSQDLNCLKADELLSEIDMYASIATNGSDREGIKLELSQGDIPQGGFLVPDCSIFSKLDYSMSNYEHLNAMINRANITLSPETNLEYLLPVSSLKLFGHQISEGLTKNNVSWEHYNLGALYWRISGDAVQAIECTKRALLYVPRQYRDIPLLNLAGIFHQGRHSKDAAVILHAAIDHAPHQPENYLALGNVYAVLADYNRSAACYDNLLKLQPGLESIVTAKQAALCFHKLENGLLEVHESLQDILSELHDYHTQQQQWLRLQERLMWEQAPFEAQLTGYTSDKLSAILSHRGQRCIQRTSADSKPTITCDFTDNQVATHLEVDVTLDLQGLLQNVELETQKISEQMTRTKRSADATFVKAKTDKVDAVSTTLNSDNLANVDSQMPEVLHPIFPASVSTSSNLYFDGTGWPSKDECYKWNLPVGEEDELDIPVYLPPENKGFQVTKMLSECIDLPEGQEHKLPWYPPVCEPPAVSGDKLFFPSALRQAESNPVKAQPILQDYFRRSVDSGKAEEAEIGQRIITAVHKKSGPGWILATLASLYWRVRSNTRNALKCLDLAFESVPKEHTDVILVSIASIFHQLGFIDDAVKIATYAFKVNYVEPSTNFLLAILHYTKNNPILAMYYMKNVLRADPDYYNGRAALLLKTWACRVKLGSYEDVKSKAYKLSEEMCSDKEAFNADGVICTPSGDQCKTAAIQCFRAENLPEGVETVPIESRPVSKLLSSQQCAKHKIGLGHSLISTLLAAEGSGGNEPDQSQLETMFDGSQQAFHMRISLGNERMPSGSNTLGDFYVSLSLSDGPVPEVVLHVYDKSGTYSLSPRGCRDIRDADWLHFTSMWQSIAARNVDIGPYLQPLPNSANEDLTPFCLDSPVSPATLDHLMAMVLRNRLPSSPEMELSEWLGLMAGDQESSLRELGAKIGVALKENATSWILAAAAALYWRVIGDTEEAIICLRQALTYVPSDMKDIPLISLANVLHRVGFHGDALEVAYIALESHPDFVVNHFTVGNIHTSMGDLEKAISFYRSSLALDANFEPAKNRLQAILCTLLFDESGSLRDTNDISGN